MASDVRIRLVHVEFLRPGKAHNQLLSPLTQYLAVCDNSNAGIVTVPYEQARFERKQKDLRYDGNGGEDLRILLDEVGEEVGKILGAVPDLPGALKGDLETIVHLRLTLSASELAMLPFEMAKSPISATASTATWLGLQTHPPVCITRNIRTVSPEEVVWPKTPRVLFISSGKNDVPFDEHHKALFDAVTPFLHGEFDVHVGKKGAPREQIGRPLTILHDPTLNDVVVECRSQSEKPYTHVHILAHGALKDDEYGLALRGENGETDVVNGERLANALTVIGAKTVHRPTVVTLATCDSAGVASLVVPGTTLAHALHEKGVPLVVASQFPLSKTGSGPLARTLYNGLLWGDNPLVLLQQLRSELHARYMTTAHDWASVVVYEALPRAIGEQLGTFRYYQARLAMEAALGRMDEAVEGSPKQAGSAKALRDSVDAVKAAVKRLPFEGPYALECIGLEASSIKRRAQAASTYAQRGGAKSADLDLDPYQLLEDSRLAYEKAVRGLLVNEPSTAQRATTLHWVLVQAVSLAIILGKDNTERREGAWEAARLAADYYKDHADVEQRAWAHSSLAELWLLKLADPTLKGKARKACHDAALASARELVRLYPNREAFPIIATCRQIERYDGWWGTPRFKDGLRALTGAKSFRWDRPFGVVKTAEEMQKILAGSSRSRGRQWWPAPAPPAASSGTPSGSGTSRRTAPARASVGPTRVATLGGRKRASAADAFLRVEMLPAAHGDCLWIEYGARGKTHRVLVDCGTRGTAKTLLERVEQVPDQERFLELFVMTHVDADHIGGALPFFKAIQRGLTIGDVWFNGWEQISGMLGAKQGEMFTTAIKDFHLPLNQWQRGNAIATRKDKLPRHQLPGGLTLTLLSPTLAQLQRMVPVWVKELKKNGLEPGTRVEYDKFLGGHRVTTSTNVVELAESKFTSDTAEANGTSIALLAEYEGAAVLLGADAYAPVLVDAIHTLLAERGGTRLKLDAFKLPHHGSQNNLSKALLDLVDCPRYLVSSNGAHFLHPDRQAIARVVKYGGTKPSLYFNYQTKFNDLWARPALKEEHDYSAHYPAEGESGLTMTLLGPKS